MLEWRVVLWRYFSPVPYQGAESNAVTWAGANEFHFLRESRMQHRLPFVGCVCWKMPIQYDRERNTLTFVGEGKAWCSTEALWLPLAWTSTDGGCVVPHVRTSLACCLRLRAECLLRDAEQPQTSLKSLDRAPSYLMRWSCTIYTLRTYVCCTISANIFVSTLF